MTQHSSLRGGTDSGKFRSVLKRYEKVKELEEKEKWSEKDSIYRLPKVKRIKFKVKKIKEAVVEGEVKEGAVPAEGAAPAAGATAGGTGAKAAGAGAKGTKEGAPSKAGAASPSEGKKPEKK